MSGVDLVDFVLSLRAELDAANAILKGQNTRFAVAPIEVETSVEVREEANGEVSFKVLGIHSGGAVTRGTARRMKLPFTPYRSDAVEGLHNTYIS